MSSTLRTVAQIPPRIKYLTAVTTAPNTGTNIIADDCYAFTCHEDAFSESVVPSGSNASGLTFTIRDYVARGYATGEYFKDLGRQLVIYDATTKLHLAIFRQVQVVNGDGTEGVGAEGATPIFVKVWSASGGGVRVARIGPGAH
jgi:hypothetical protein